MRRIPNENTLPGPVIYPGAVLGLASAALAAANSMHTAAIITESSLTLLSNLPLPSSPDPLLPDLSLHLRAAGSPP
jgi:hypothetical protein